MSPPKALILFAAFALVPAVFALRLEQVRNDYNFPRPVVDIEDLDKGVVAQLFVSPGETMKLDSKENPVAGAGFFQAMPGEVYYITILPIFKFPRLESNLCPCLLHVDRVGWGRDGTLNTVVGMRAFLQTTTGAKIPIVSDVNHPRMDKGRLYFRLQGHGGGDYWVLTRFGQVVDVGGPWGPWELIKFVVTIVVPIVLGCTLLYSVAGGIVYFRADAHPQKSFIELMQLSLSKPPFFQKRATEGEWMEEEPQAEDHVG